MELRQLRYFVKAAETLNFSDAARALCIAQSTLSQQIKQLEDELGVLLFQRGSHSISLTEAGAELLSPATSTIREAEVCVERVQDLRQLLTGTLNIGVTFSFSPILTETITEFMKQYPGVKLNIFYKQTDELMQMLERRQVDFVLAFRTIERRDGVESHVLFENHLAAIVKSNHALAALDKVTPADLARFPIALPSKGLQARNAFDHLLAGHQPGLNVRLELNEVNILLKLIRKSNLVTILAEATVYNETGIKALALDIPANEMDGCVHMLKNSYHKHSALQFIRLLRDSSAVRARSPWFG
ncbi:MAG: LysR family transcriptional regulator [Muribaculaceae bacterium]|nr:LysR family transcriptional regulator [Muribaculaceae bacterium]